jgi:hypothetical protein
MSNRPPDLHDLIGDEGDPRETERLERVHDMLVVAGPPPSGAVPHTPQVGGRKVVRMAPRRWAELAVAAAIACVAVGFGYFLGNRSDGMEPVAVIAMHGLAPVAGATAELEVGETDAAGNIPIEMQVEGLPAPPQGGWYQLLLSKGREIGASCGTFTTAGGETTVRLSVAYDLAEWREAGRYDGWVVTAFVPGKPATAKRILLTT